MLKTIAMTVAVAAVSLSAIPLASADPMMHMSMHERMMMKRHHMMMMEHRHMMMRHRMMHRDM